jgi:hypothetical protein
MRPSRVPLSIRSVFAGSLLVLSTLVGCATSRAPALSSDLRGLPKPNAPVPEEIRKTREEWSRKPELAACDTPPDYSSDAFQALESSQWQKARDLSASWIQLCPVDIRARVVANIALNELGLHEDAEKQRVWASGLVNAVLESGDGRTPATAYKVLTIPDEYAVLEILGYKVESQALLEGHIDGLEATGEDGESIRVYFYPEAHWRLLGT